MSNYCTKTGCPNRFASTSPTGAHIDNIRFVCTNCDEVRYRASPSKKKRKSKLLIVLVVFLLVGAIGLGIFAFVSSDTGSIAASVNSTQSDSKATPLPTIFQNLEADKRIRLDEFKEEGDRVNFSYELSRHGKVIKSGQGWFDKVKNKIELNDFGNGKLIESFDQETKKKDVIITLDEQNGGNVTYDDIGYTQ